MFGEYEDETKELDDAAAAGENGALALFPFTTEFMLSLVLEIDNLRKEASAFAEVRDTMLSSENDDATASVVFKKVTQ